MADNLLENFKKSFASLLYGITKQDAHKQGICIDCKSPINVDSLDDIDKREYFISGICPNCWNIMFIDE
jgi:hypothetical protein